MCVGTNVHIAEREMCCFRAHLSSVLVSMFSQFCHLLPSPELVSLFQLLTSFISFTSVYIYYSSASYITCFRTIQGFWFFNRWTLVDSRCLLSQRLWLYPQDCPLSTISMKAASVVIKNKYSNDLIQTLLVYVVHASNFIGL